MAAAWEVGAGVAAVMGVAAGVAVGEGSVVVALAVVPQQRWEGVVGWGIVGEADELFGH